MRVASVEIRHGIHADASSAASYGHLGIGVVKPPA
jgi:hypothetical protein